MPLWFPCFRTLLYSNVSPWRRKYQLPLMDLIWNVFSELRGCHITTTSFYYLQSSGRHPAHVRLVTIKTFLNVFDRSHTDLSWKQLGIVVARALADVPLDDTSPKIFKTSPRALWMQFVTIARRNILIRHPISVSYADLNLALETSTRSTVLSPTKHQGIDDCTREQWTELVYWRLSDQMSIWETPSWSLAILFTAFVQNHWCLSAFLNLRPTSRCPNWW